MARSGIPRVGTPTSPLASLSKEAEDDLGVPIERNPARMFFAYKLKLLTYGQMAISPLIVQPINRSAHRLKRMGSGCREGMQ